MQIIFQLRNSKDLPKPSCSLLRYALPSQLPKSLAACLGVCPYPRVYNILLLLLHKQILKTVRNEIELLRKLCRCMRTLGETSTSKSFTALG